MKRVCAHCGSADAGCRWFTRACADGSKNKYRWLCNECDYKLNDVVLRFFKIENAEEKMQLYSSEIQPSN
jgi:hypothetical protein